MKAGVLQGKSAIITGASKGIGAAIAQRFAREGANVLLNYRSSEEQALTLSESLRGTGATVIPYRADVANTREVRKMVAKALKEFGRIDVLVNNAGILLPKDFLETTEEDFDRVIGVNLRGAYFLCQQVAPVMLKQKQGKIINISSISGLAVPSGLTYVHYVVSKAGMIGLTRALAVRLGPHVHVNAICPGTVETDIVAPLSKKVKAGMAEEALVKRLGRPEEIASAAVFLASDESDFVTGEMLTVGGGRGMR